MFFCIFVIRLFVKIPHEIYDDNCHSSNPPPRRIQAANMTSSVPLAATFRAKLWGTGIYLLVTCKPCISCVISLLNSLRELS